MKQHTIIQFCCSVAVFLLFNSANSQQDITMAQIQPKANLSIDKSIIELPAPVATKSLNAEDVSSKTQKSFYNFFKGATPSWSEVDKNFLATFELEGRNARALFTESGYPLYTIIRGKEKDLPSIVRNIIRSTYYDFAIGTVNEVRVDDKTAWFVNLQSDKELIVVRVLDNELDEFSHHTLGH